MLVETRKGKRDVPRLLRADPAPPLPDGRSLVLRGVRDEGTCEPFGENPRAGRHLTMGKEIRP